jgi:hypothetical protein
MSGFRMVLAASRHRDEGTPTMKPRASAVRMSIAIIVILGTINLVAIGSNGVTGAATHAFSASGLANAKLPPGMCGSSDLPVTLSNGSGISSAHQDSINYFSISLSSGPLTIDINHDGIKDLAVVFRCNFGGSFTTTALWLFDGRKSGFTVLAGPIYGRTGQIQSVAIRGKDLVMSEKFHTAQDPDCCPSGSASTTWAWHNKALRIIRPTSTPGTTTVKAAPTDTPGGPGTTKLSSGTHVAVVCTEVTGLTPGPKRWDQLDTGDWLPSKDVKTTSRPPVCRTSSGASPPSQSVTTTTHAPIPTTTMPITTTVPAASQITLASLDAAVAAQSDAVVAAQAGIRAAEVATCGPPSVSFAVGTDILCHLLDPTLGGAMEVIQIAGSTPSSFTVVVGAGSDIPCAGLNAAEQAAFTADGESCDANE